MRRLGLVLRTARHHWRAHLAVVGVAALTSAVLTGALIVGDSVRATLRGNALDRLGNVDIVVSTGDRLFQDDLAHRVEAALDGDRAASVLLMRGVAASTDGTRVAGAVQMHGIDAAFADLMDVEGDTPSPDSNGVVLNRRLADDLAVVVGDTIVLRVAEPSALPRDAALVTDQASVALRVRVQAIIDGGYGRFSLVADQLPPRSAFLSRTWLQDQLELPGRANVLLVGPGEHESAAQRTTRVSDPEAVDGAIRSAFSIADAQVAIEPGPGPNEIDVVTERIFLDDAITRAVGEGTRFLTYFVTGIDFKDRSTPYSMVSAIGPATGDTGGIDPAPLPRAIGHSAIVVTEWLAEDLGCAPGDEVTLRSFVLDEDDALVEISHSFTIEAVVPMTGLAADPTLMPEFPGIAEAETSRDWDPGIPIDLGLIRDKDEEYWDQHRGTPKAFIALSAGQAMWSNRYGNLTSIRLTAPAGTRDEFRDALTRRLRDTLDPASFGLTARDVRTPALQASRATTDFGGLFLGLSFFIILAALLLTAMLFRFGIERRATEIGLCLAMGFTARAVRRLLLLEGIVLALVGATLGAPIGIVYTRLVLGALSGIWSDAVAAAPIRLSVSGMTMIIGLIGSVLSAGIAIHLTTRSLLRHEVVDLLAGETSDEGPGITGAGKISRVLAPVALLAALAIMVLAPRDGKEAASFFGAGSLLLIGALAICRLLLVRLGRQTGDHPGGFGSLALRNIARRSGRSLTTTAMLACGVFLVVAVTANRLDANRDASARSSGTGGFAFIGTTTLPVYVDLNTVEGAGAFGLGPRDMQDVAVVGLRVREGDDASCLNLNRPQVPRLLGVDARALADRTSFSFVKSEGDLREAGWQVLRSTRDDGAIPAIVDDASATWSMHKSVGDTIEYIDESGQVVRLVIAATIANSILQGNVIIDDDRFREVYPSEAGARVLLIDAPEERRTALEGRLRESMTDVGLELTSAPHRLAEFNAVQNAYLSIFQMLGGIGLLLGSAGLGIVVTRNVLERRRETALLLAVGFRPQVVRALLVREHVVLLLMGLGSGGVAAFGAVLPALTSTTQRFPLEWTVGLLLILLTTGWAWIQLAAHSAVRQDLLDVLRHEG